jgi:hypothetical protein
MDEKQKYNESDMNNEWFAGNPATATNSTASAKESKGSGKKKKKSNRNKMIIRILLLLGIPLLLAASLAGGLVVGYSVLGNEPSSEMWDFTALKHIVALVFGE